MSSNQKKSLVKVVGNFTYWVANFFYFDEITKMSLPGILRKNIAFLALEAAFLRFRQNKKKLPPNM